MYKATYSPLKPHSEEDGVSDILERLPLETLEHLQRLDGSRCLLCGSQEFTVTHRLLGEHLGTNGRPLLWLIGLGVFSGTYRAHDPANIMTLCEPHACAYDEAAWRRVPAEEWRERMAHWHPSLTDHARPQDNVQAEIAVGEEVQSEVRSGVPPIPESDERDAKLNTFDLVIFRPQHMPQRPILRRAGSASVAIDAAALGPAPAPVTSARGSQHSDGGRVLRAWRALRFDPFIAFAATLSAAGGAYAPLPSVDVRAVEGDCERIRSAWDRGLPSGAPSWDLVWGE